jgi:hypothetical protein
MNRDKNWQKEASVSNESMQTYRKIDIMSLEMTNRKMTETSIRSIGSNPNLKVQGSGVKVARLKLTPIILGCFKDAGHMVARLISRRKRREYPEVSYVSSFPSRTFQASYFVRSLFLITLIGGFLTPKTYDIYTGEYDLVPSGKIVQKGNTLEIYDHPYDLRPSSKIKSREKLLPNSLIPQNQNGYDGRP